MSAGRPTKYDPAFADQARQYCLLGATNERLAGFFGVDISTLERWIAAHDEFRGAIKEGREGADIQVANSLYGKALSGDTTACIFWLKNRQKLSWRDKHDVEHTGADGKPLPTEFTIKFVEVKGGS